MSSQVLTHGVWDHWKALKKIFPTYSIIWEGLFSPGSLGLIGNDFVTGLRRNATTRKTLALTAPLDAKAFQDLNQVAKINLERQQTVFRAFSVVYFTVPITIFATMSQMDPGAMRRVLETVLTRSDYIGVLVGVVATLPVLFLGVWRARQMCHVLQIAAIEQGRDLSA